MWDIKEAANGTWEWSVFHSAYGAAGGKADSLDAAKVALAIAEADLLERPFPTAVADAMRADPGRFAPDYPNPEGA